MQESGQLRSLERHADVHIERPGEGRTTLQKHRLAIRNERRSVLFAVMRGAAAEGTDLVDDEARCVVVIGVPFPALSLDVDLKRQQSGARWYESEAYRQVSQAAGRMLRHQRDFGSLVLLDVRYARRKPLMQVSAQASLPALSPWIQRLLQPVSLESCVADLATFFQSFSSDSDSKNEKCQAAALEAARGREQQEALAAGASLRPRRGILLSGRSARPGF
jgi:Rad3-related DNA helicase